MLSISCCQAANSQSIHTSYPHADHPVWIVCPIAVPILIQIPVSLAVPIPDTVQSGDEDTCRPLIYALALSAIWLRTARSTLSWHVPPLANQMFLLFKATNVVAFYCLLLADNEQRRRSQDKLQPRHILTAIVLELITNCTSGTQLLSVCVCVCVLMKIKR